MDSKGYNKRLFKIDNSFTGHILSTVTLQSISHKHTVVEFEHILSTHNFQFAFLENNVSQQVNDHNLSQINSTITLRVNSFPDFYIKNSH